MSLALDDPQKTQVLRTLLAADADDGADSTGTKAVSDCLFLGKTSCPWSWGKHVQCKQNAKWLLAAASC